MMRWLLACAMGVLMHAGTAPAEEGEARGAEARGVGMEGEVRVVLDRGDYVPRPLDDRTPLIVRIESVSPAAQGTFTYDLQCIGFEPGPHRLADYLMQPDGSPAESLAGTTFEVRSILPPGHDGALNTLLPQAFPWFGGYRMLLGGLAALWLIGLAVLALAGRRRKSTLEAAPPAPQPTIAERLRPLVEAAANGTLSADGMAGLERLMTSYWREKLGLPEARMAEQVAALKRDPQAGELLRAMERWLHQPGGATDAEILAVLRPYGSHAETPTEVTP